MHRYLKPAHPLHDRPVLRRETGLLEVMCVHGVGHPIIESVRMIAALRANEKTRHYAPTSEHDEESNWYLIYAEEANTLLVHGCDGCCSRGVRISDEEQEPEVGHMLQRGTLYQPLHPGYTLREILVAACQNNQLINAGGEDMPAGDVNVALRWMKNLYGLDNNHVNPQRRARFTDSGRAIEVQSKDGKKWFQWATVSEGEPSRTLLESQRLSNPVTK